MPALGLGQKVPGGSGKPGFFGKGGGLANLNSKLAQLSAFTGNPLIGAGLGLLGNFLGGESEDTKFTRKNRQEADVLGGKVLAGVDPGALVRAASLIRRGAQPAINAGGTVGTGRFGSGSGFARGAANKSLNQAIVPQLAGLESRRVFGNFNALQSVFGQKFRAGLKPLAG